MFFKGRMCYLRSIPKHKGEKQIQGGDYILFKICFYCPESTFNPTHPVTASKPVHTPSSPRAEEDNSNTAYFLLSGFT
jgi:hypothetical protein